MTTERESTAPPIGEWDPLAGRWMEPRLGSATTNGARSPWFSPGLRNGIVGGIVGALAASLILIPIARNNGSTIVERRLASGPGPVVNGKSVVEIAAAARPWVVNIDVKHAAEFLGGAVAGLGSGLILRSDGFILTSAHVVRDASSIEVTLASGERLKARTVGIDDDTDVGVIKVDKQRLPAAVIGSAKNLRVGDVAIAIGSPLGLEQTVTEGIISALGRTVRAQSGSPPLVDMIQTDAPITHGNSGGALINGEGAVIGINTAIGTATGQSVGIGFATPIDVAVAIAHELIATGHATHPWLGVTGSNITSATAERFGVDEGALMVQVLPDGPAGRAGMRPNDVVVSFDGGRIKSMDELIVAIRNHKVGQRIAVEVVRRERHLTLYPTLVEKAR
jgi:S1-C subfamily serine protease